jgi:hypothetical protein
MIKRFIILIALLMLLFNFVKANRELADEYVRIAWSQRLLYSDYTSYVRYLTRAIQLYPNHIEALEYRALINSLEFNNHDSAIYDFIEI